jgi:hypothetical protein
MKFETKNNFIVKHKNGNYFDADLILFKRVFPNHRLHDDLRRVNDFNRHILDGKMLYELLNKVSPTEILKNRETPIPDFFPSIGTNNDPETVSTIDEVKGVFVEQGIVTGGMGDDVFKPFLGKTKDAIVSALGIWKSMQAEDTDETPEAGTGEATQESTGTQESATPEIKQDKPVESETAKPETVVVEAAPEKQKKSKVKEANK